MSCSHCGCRLKRRSPRFSLCICSKPFQIKLQNIDTNNTLVGSTVIDDMSTSDGDKSGPISNPPKRVKLIRPTSLKRGDIAGASLSPHSGIAESKQLSQTGSAVKDTSVAAEAIPSAGESKTLELSSVVSQSVTTTENKQLKPLADKSSEQKNLCSIIRTEKDDIESKTDGDNTFRTFSEETLKQIEELKKLNVGEDNTSKSPNTRRPKLIRPALSRSKTNSPSTPKGSDSPLSKDTGQHKHVYVPSVQDVMESPEGTVNVYVPDSDTEILCRSETTDKNEDKSKTKDENKCNSISLPQIKVPIESESPSDKLLVTEDVVVQDSKVAKISVSANIVSHESDAKIAGSDAVESDTGAKQASYVESSENIVALEESVRYEVDSDEVKDVPATNEESRLLMTVSSERNAAEATNNETCNILETSVGLENDLVENIADVTYCPSDLDATYIDINIENVEPSSSSVNVTNECDEVTEEKLDDTFDFSSSEDKEHDSDEGKIQFHAVMKSDTVIVVKKSDASKSNSRQRKSNKCDTDNYHTVENVEHSPTDVIQYSDEVGDLEEYSIITEAETVVKNLSTSVCFDGNIELKQADQQEGHEVVRKDTAQNIETDLENVTAQEEEEDSVMMKGNETPQEDAIKNSAEQQNALVDVFAHSVLTTCENNSEVKAPNTSDVSLFSQLAAPANVENKIEQACPDIDAKCKNSDQNFKPADSGHNEEIIEVNEISSNTLEEVSKYSISDEFAQDAQTDLESAINVTQNAVLTEPGETSEEYAVSLEVLGSVVEPTSVDISEDATEKSDSTDQKFADVDQDMSEDLMANNKMEEDNVEKIESKETKDISGIDDFDCNEIGLVKAGDTTYNMVCDDVNVTEIARESVADADEEVHVSTCSAMSENINTLPSVLEVLDKNIEEAATNAILLNEIEETTESGALGYTNVGDGSGDEKCFLEKNVKNDTFVDRLSADVMNVRSKKEEEHIGDHIATEEGISRSGIVKEDTEGAGNDEDDDDRDSSDNVDKAQFFDHDVRVVVAKIEIPKEDGEPEKKKGAGNDEDGNSKDNVDEAQFPNQDVRIVLPKVEVPKEDSKVEKNKKSAGNNEGDDRNSSDNVDKAQIFDQDVGVVVAKEVPEEDNERGKKKRCRRKKSLLEVTEKLHEVLSKESEEKRSSLRSASRIASKGSSPLKIGPKTSKQSPDKHLQEKRTSSEPKGDKELTSSESSSKKQKKKMPGLIPVLQTLAVQPGSSSAASFKPMPGKEKANSAESVSPNAKESKQKTKRTKQNVTEESEDSSGLQHKRGISQSSEVTSAAVECVGSKKRKTSVVRRYDSEELTDDAVRYSKSDLESKTETKDARVKLFPVNLQTNKDSLFEKVPTKLSISDVKMKNELQSLFSSRFPSSASALGSEHTDPCTSNVASAQSDIDVSALSKKQIKQMRSSALAEGTGKDSSSRSMPSCIEQAASNWSAPDIMRVERLLKESNITITPVPTGKECSQPKPLRTPQEPCSKVGKSTLPLPCNIPPVQFPALFSSVMNQHQMYPNPAHHSNVFPPTFPFCKDPLTQKYGSVGSYPLKEGIQPGPSSAMPHSSLFPKNPMDYALPTMIPPTPMAINEMMQNWAKSFRKDFWSSTLGKYPKQVDVKSEIRKKIACSEQRKHKVKEDKPSAELAVPVPHVSSPVVSEYTSPSVPASSAEGVPAPLPSQEVENKKRPGRPRGSGKRGRPPKSFSLARGEGTRQSKQQDAEETEEQTEEQKSAGEGGEDSIHKLCSKDFEENTFKMFGKGQPEEADGSKKDDESTSTSGVGAENEQVTYPIPLFDIAESTFENQSVANEDAQKQKVEETPVERPRRGRKRKAVIIPELEHAAELDQEEITRLEEERVRKEMEKERKIEERKQRLKERNELAKQKRLRQKMKAEERQKKLKEKKLQLQEEKKKLEEELKKLPSQLPNYDDETRMSADSASVSVPVDGIADDESCSNATNESSQRSKKSRMEVCDVDNSKDFTVEQIAEYQWPIQGGELYMIQEQVSRYLGVKSFKRRYPDIKRRAVDKEERAYLVDSGLVSESLCNLGLTAVYSSEILDIMFQDFTDRYEELRRHMREKQAKELSFKQKAWANGLGYKLLMADGTKQDLKRRAMESASNWNATLNKSRTQDRRCALDLQTYIIHYPRKETKKKNQQQSPKPGSYPVSILPGQYCDYYKRYTPDELRYLPLNSVLYGPVCQPDPATLTSLNDISDSSSSSCSSCSSSSSSDDEADSSSENEVSKERKPDVTQMDLKMECIENGVQLTVKLENIKDERITQFCEVCKGNGRLAEDLIRCSNCNSINHPACLSLSAEIIPQTQKYSWQCVDCKTCNRCKAKIDKSNMARCSLCDRGYHIQCVSLSTVPQDQWNCGECLVCVKCGITAVGSTETSQWYFEQTQGSRVQQVLCHSCAENNLT